MTTLGVAAIQTAGDKKDNLALVEREITATVKRLPWVSLVVLGELCINGANPALAEPAGGPTETRLCELARELGIWIVPGSLYEQRGDKVFNTTPVIDPAGEIIARYDKMFPFLPYEKGVEAGETFVTFDIPGAGRLGIVICYDIWFPETIRTLAGMGAEAVLVPTMTNTIDRDVELAIARTNAATNQVYMVDVNVAGDQGMGRSVVYGPGGETVYEAAAGAEVIAVELDFNQVRRTRERGWNGLGQTLKSFRDSNLEFPLHASPQARRKALRDLGALETPQADSLAKQPAQVRVAE